MISAHNLCLNFGPQTIFDDLSFTFQGNQRIGVAGRNGAGKSTLLKVVAGQQQPDSGSIFFAKDKQIAYLPQEVVLESHQNILQETFSTFEKIEQLEDEQKKLELILDQDNVSAETIDRYSEICEQLAELNPDNARAETKKILLGLGFTENQFDKSVSTLSTGWRMRIVLAKLLLKKADFYLFDEPTNHLDIVAKEWFVEFLKNAPFGFMIVSHERYFLDQLCTHILELEQGRHKLYTGNYSHYEKQKERDLELLTAARNQQQKELKQKMDTVQRFRAKSSKARMAQSMLKSIKRIELITLPPTPKNINFSFPPLKQPGRIVLKVNGVSHAFSGKGQIFHNASFEVQRGKKIAIIAPNGVGKTTLFNIIANKLKLQNGSVEFGHNVDYALFDQDQSKLFEPKQSMLKNLNNHCPKVPDQKIRTLLGAFLFDENDLQKPAQVLSGGEKNRIGMTRVLLQDANLLLLDEPTNHLDIASKEVLLNALKKYQGTILFVSHDHDFVNKLATDIIELNANGTHVYHGNYEEYLFHKKQMSGDDTIGNQTFNAQPKTKSKKIQNNKELFQLNKRSKSLERKIEKLEKEINKIELSFADASYGSENYQELDTKLRTLKKELEQCCTDWEKIQEKIEKNS
ncbi:ABC-F family ATP-binding cassette domain-containing protein [Candidatus Dependentiae bacterium]|nr:ABC-F family ATP-binding cassette domain-containing protein [Candidatus Dependentiae bacterium]